MRRYMLVPEPCWCDGGSVQAEFVDYGCAGGGWAYERHESCGGSGVYRRKVEFVQWLHSLPVSHLIGEEPSWCLTVSPTTQERSRNERADA